MRANKFLNTPNPKKQRRISNYLFDGDDYRMSLTDRPQRLNCGKYELEIVENSGESVTRRPDPNQKVFSHFSLYRRVWEYIVFLVSAAPLIEVSFVTIFVTKLQNPSTTPNSNRPTKSVLLLREAQLAKIKEASQKETMFLFSPEYENYLKLEKNGQLPRRKLPTFTECIKTSKSTLRSPITKPLT